MAKLISNIKEISDQYQVFIIDLWGVIYDGTTLYEDAINTLKHLKDHKKTILFLSNSPKRATKVIKSLNNLGISKDLYDYIVTSGEFFFKNLDDLSSGNKFFHLGPVENEDILDESTYNKTDLESCDFILTTGLFDDKKGFSEELEILQKAKTYNLPMICINPDIIVISQQGKEYLCAGAVAKEYEKIGGKVTYHGKPYENIYHYANLILQIEKNKIIAIGDSLNTDIKGANNFGIDSLLITSGIHFNELKKLSIEKLFQNYNMFPSFYTKLFN